MEFSPRAAELTTLLESRITNFHMNFQVDDNGQVSTAGDGIARGYGLKEIHTGEMVMFASSVKGLALTLEKRGIEPSGSHTSSCSATLDLQTLPYKVGTFN